MNRGRPAEVAGKIHNAANSMPVLRHCATPR